MDPVTPLIILAGVSAAGEGAMQYKASGEREKALESERKQRELQFQQKTLANYDLTNKILDRQLVQASARGVALSSPSIEAQQRQAVNVGAKRQQVLDTEEDIFERNVRTEKENVQNILGAQLFGDITQFTAGAIGAERARPKSSKVMPEKINGK